ncbi:MAG: nucleotidyltransferase domain-containing protein [Thermoanaerobaculia bacterium]
MNDMLVPSAEYALLLACARSRMDERHAATIRELSRTAPNWKTIVALGRRHSLFPLLYRQLAAIVPNEVPPEFLDELKMFYQGNAARNLFLHGELERVLRALDDDGVTAIPYKGPALAILGYGDLSLRRFVDLDVIVRKEDVDRAVNTLIAIGYRLDPPVPPSQQALLIRTQHDLVFKRDEGRLLVELHWEVAPRRFASELTAEDLWQRATKRKVGRGELLTLSPEDMLLSLCVHGSKHLWERLAWVCDLAEWLASHPDLQWSNVVDQAHRNGQQRMLFTGLQLAAELIDAPLPETVARAIDADDAVARLTERAKAVMFHDPPRFPGMITTLRFNLLARPTWSGRMSYLRHLLSPTDGDIRAFRAPPFVYYLARPFRLLGKKEHLH